MGVVTTNILFSSYAHEEHVAIVDAFEPVNVTADTNVIRQGFMTIAVVKDASWDGDGSHAAVSKKHSTQF